MPSAALRVDDGQAVPMRVDGGGEIGMAVEGGTEIGLRADGEAYDSGLRYAEVSNEFGTTITIG